MTSKAKAEISDLKVSVQQMADDLKSGIEALPVESMPTVLAYFENKMEGAKKTLEQMTEMTRDLADVKKAMGIAVEMFELEWPKFMESSKKALEDTRLWRMAQSRELRETAAVLEDVGRILHKSDLVTDALKLKELVETLERLKALHDSGFLEQALKGMGYERK